MISPGPSVCKFIFILLLIPITLSAQDGWTEPINLSNSPEKNIRGASAVVDNNGVIYVVWGERLPITNKETSINLSKSTDNGLTWSEPEIISDNHGVYWDPEIAVDSKGNLHVIYLNLYKNRYFYITSENGWSIQTPISDYDYAYYARIIVDKKDQIHFFWSHWQPPQHIVHRTLFEGVWSDTTIASNLSVNSVGCEAVVDEGNILHLVYEGFPGSNFELIYKRLDEYGWSEPEKITKDSLDISHFKLTLVDEDQPLVAWDQLVSWYDTLIIRIYWNRKILGKWLIPEQLSDLSKSYYPGLTTDKNNISHAMWNKNTHRAFPTANDSLFYSCYQNDIWSNAEKVPFNLPSPLTNSFLKNFGDRIYLFFRAENEANRSDLYFSSRSILTGVKELQHEKYENYLNVYPNPFNAETRIRYKLDTPSRAEIKLFDILGREIQTLTDKEKTAGEYELHFNANYLASGVYFLRLRANNQNTLRKLIITK